MTLNPSVVRPPQPPLAGAPRATTDLARALVSRSGEATAGARVGRYRLVARTRRRLVIEYTAVDERTGASAVLRFVDVSYDAHARQRAHDEARALVGLSHPHLSPVHETGEVDGLTWIACTPPSGPSLLDWAQDELPSAEQILAIVVQVADVLAMTHAAGVLHRDLTPRRIIIGRDHQPTLAGFTLADVSGSIQQENRWGADRGLTGDLAYLAPEQLDGLPATEASDQYSLAVIAYTALYGVHPFGGGSDIASLYGAVKHQPLPTPPSVRVLPRRVLRAIARGLAVDPGHRFSSVGALRSALRLSPFEWPKPRLRLVRR